MKIGWLVYDHDGCVEFFKIEPLYYNGRLVQIVYSEVVE